MVGLRIFFLLCCISLVSEVYASVDSDGDGFSDDQETTLGTNPNDHFNCPAPYTHTPEFFVDTDGDALKSASILTTITTIFGIFWSKWRVLTIMM